MLRGLVVVLLLASVGACRPRGHATHLEDTLMTQRADLASVLARHTPRLMDIPGVTGTGEGRRDGRPVIVIFVARRSVELARRLPAELEGYPVEMRESGEVTAPPR